MRTLLSVSAAITLALVALAPARADEATDKEIQSLLDKAIQAHGGEANLTKHKAVTTKGKGKIHVMAMDFDFTITVIVQKPSQIWLEVTVEINGMSIAFTQAIDGDKGWIKVMDKVIDMDADKVAEGKAQMYSREVETLVPLKKDKAFTLKTLGETKIEGTDAVGILVTRKDQRDVSLYFDKKTSLLIKSESRGKDTDNGNKEFTGETFYSDYKEFDGVKHAMKLKQKRDGKEFLEMEMTEVTPQDKIDAATFAKPKE
jgi:hypothetical protein